MDSFDIESLEKILKKYRSNIINRFENIELSDKDLKYHCDKLCMVLDYSPRQIEEKIFFDKFKLKNYPNLKETGEKNIAPSLNLNSKQNQIDVDGENKEKESATKLSRLTSKLEIDMPNEGQTFVEIRSILIQIINKAIEGKNHNEDEIDDEEDEYMRMIEQRRNKMDDNYNSVAKLGNNTLPTSGFMNKISDKVRVYLLKTQCFIDIPISFNDTIRYLKQRIILQLQSVNTFKLKSTIAEGYEIRMIEKDSLLPNMEFPPLDDNLNIVKTQYNIVAFVEKKSFDSEAYMSYTSNSILGPTIMNSEMKVTLKIFFKMDTEGTKSTVIQENGDKTLKNVLEKLAIKSKINNKNLDLYYFVEHVENQKEGEEDIDNAINLDTPLKFFNNYHLDLNYKKFSDAPDLIVFSQLNQRIVNHPEFYNTYHHKNIIKLPEESGREFQFNDNSAGLYQEFEVMKINKFKIKQSRILGIDLYYLYNNLPKKNQNKRLTNMLYGGTKNPLRKIKDIQNCDYISQNTFFIETKVDGKVKQIVYETKHVNVKKEIVAKLKHLIKMNQSVKEIK